nr:MAG TPA: hypothetical protein [Crassvirales sp.]
MAAEAKPKPLLLLLLIRLIKLFINLLICVKL